jgi:hypothetical protein
MSSPPPPHRPGERGSAYILALLAMVVLGILGLSLALTTQSELQIAANELSATRAFYAADSGVNMAVARVLTVNSSVDDTTVTSVTPMEFLAGESLYEGGAGARRQRAEVTPFVPIRDAFCDMCPAAEGDVQLRAVTHAVAATGRRLLEGPEGNEGAARIQASSQIFLMIGLQPWWPPNWQAIADEAQVAKISQTGRLIQ